MDGIFTYIWFSFMVQVGKSSHLELILGATKHVNNSGGDVRAEKGDNPIVYGFVCVSPPPVEKSWIPWGQRFSKGVLGLIGRLRKG